MTIPKPKHYSNECKEKYSKVFEHIKNYTIHNRRSRFERDETNVNQFEQGLIHIAQTELVAEVAETIYGEKYVIDGELETPSGDMIHLRTVWIIETGDDIPRLITAYPLD